MSIAICHSAHISGLSAGIVTVEVDISNGLNSLSIVGLGDRAVEEAKDRVSAAVKNSGYISPKQKNQKVVVSLAPADMRKEGAAFDLPIALAYLAAAGDISFEPGRIIFLGELSLDGKVRRASGILPMLCQAAALGFTAAFVPAENAEEASLADGLTIWAVSSLREAVAILADEGASAPIAMAEYREAEDAADASPAGAAGRMPDMREIRGNEAAKRALEIAAAGAHNLLMHGPPGTGKTMLAQSFPTILPPLSRAEAVEVTGIHSVARTLGGAFVRMPPFRAPHHTASYPSIVGGGSFPRPGEITLAHRGVLFLDELPEFDRSVLEALRQPLEEGAITISRARGSVTFPARCIVIASMNPCPCGKPRGKGCICNDRDRALYRRRVSGPIMDRFDITADVSKVDYEKLAEMGAGDAEPSEAVRARVARARLAQAERFSRYGISKRYNSEMEAADIDRCAALEEPARRELMAIARRLSFSGRAFHRVIKVARTIADLAGAESISTEMLMEAAQYRQKAA